MPATLGQGLREAGILVWNVDDPVGSGEKKMREVRDDIEQRVTGLLIRLRRERQA